MIDYIFLGIGWLLYFLGIIIEKQTEHYTLLFMFAFHFWGFGLGYALCENKKKVKE